MGKKDPVTEEAHKAKSRRFILVSKTQRPGQTHQGVGWVYRPHWHGMNRLCPSSWSSTTLTPTIVAK